MPIPTSRALIVTEDPELGPVLVDVLDACGVHATITLGANAIDRLIHEDPDFILTDLDIKESDPLQLLQQVRGTVGRDRLLLLASEKSMGRAADAAELGIFGYMKKPISPAEMEAAIRRVRYESQNSQLQSARVIGSNPAIQTAVKLALQVALGSEHLMLVGERGVGKHLLARLIHENSSRRCCSFRQFSCEGQSERVVNSELFGCGDFPDDSEEVKAGLLKQCHQGTLLIDEILKLPVKCQEYLLKCLKLKSVRPFGRRGNAISCDVRIVAASSVDLEEAVRTGEFNRELFELISGVRVELVPLRDRKSDIPMLGDHFVRQSGRFTGRNLKGISPEGLDRLLRYDWPGNVRELEDMIAHAAAVASGVWVGVEDLPALPDTVVSQGGIVLGSTIQDIEKAAILSTLEATGGSTSRAAKILNMSVRKIQYKLKEYRRDAVLTLRSETVHSVPTTQLTSSQNLIPAKKTEFLADRGPVD